ncbi:LuxR C-terminal-related transcriptional regulator [Bailinhaonella thermotolerans]|uniref:LuxR family transcriptional regulator n=1 Tax=Bailinhaonella thermotolerans TaxID=1070861 RepID=A0A3A4AY24_9ACTN|nr:LuxR family transcriptional regulator [Bailinhaonella thermotolerans]RJL30777.1 LuxR family transcriptional regulator [Bailinhaonella thermotolerans]
MRSGPRGRRNERAAGAERVGKLIEDLRAGRGGALVVRGEPGIGKTTLLDDAVRRAAAVRRDAGPGGDVRVLRAAGVEAEAGLPFAALQMLLRPALGRLDALPDTQAAALRGALGLAAGAGADRFLVGVAVVGLLSELAAERPVLCLVDDAHWLDPASAEALLFAARRLTAEAVAVVFATRDGFEAPGLPELELTGLDPEAAAALLAEHAPDLSPAVRDRVIAEAAGNPLALLELPAGLDAAQRAGIAATPAALPVTGRVLAAFGAQIGRLPAGARTALLVAAAEGTGDLGTVLRAARALGASAADLEAAERADLVRTTGVSVAFRHPLVRSAAYQDAPLTARIAAHEALAGVLDGDRRALHLAAAATGPDEAIAAELERAAASAGARGALASAVPIYERAAGLSPDPGERARRLTVAAQSAITSGLTEQAGALAERAARLTADPALRAGLAMVRATVEFERGSPRGAARHLLENAEPIAGEDPGLALVLLVLAAGDAWASGEEATLRAVASLAAALRPGGTAATGAVPGGLVAGDPRVTASVSGHGSPATGPDRIAASVVALAGLAAGDFAGALPVLQELVTASRTAPAPGLIARIHVCGIALALGDDEAALELAAHDIGRSRRRGTTGALPTMLLAQAWAQLGAGLHPDAEASVDEALLFVRDTGQNHRFARLGAVTARLAAIEGDQARCLESARRTGACPGNAGGGIAETVAAGECAVGLLDLGLGRYAEAVRRLSAVARGPVRYTAAALNAVPDLVEAAARAGSPEAGREAFARYAAWARASVHPWVKAVALRCEALLAGEDAGAGELFADAVRLHAEGGRPFERARTELAYGEWLRRARRRSDARGPLRSALEIFGRLNAAPWAERARTELRATGETAPAHRPGEDVLDRLTPQELQVVRLAAGGASNRDIAARLFLSHRTVEYHLYKAYPKLGVTSRTELSRLPALARAADPA